MIWFGFAVMIGTILISAASLRSSRGDALGIPLAALGTFTFLYVIQPLRIMLSGSMDLFLTNWQVTKALLIPALLLACFIWGWSHSGRRQRHHQTLSWDPGAMWNVGFVAAWVGLILWVVFMERSGGIVQSYSQAHHGGMDFNQNTAYLYDGPFLMLSGAVMMIFADPVGRRLTWRNAAPYAFITLYLANGVLGGDRSPIFAAGSAAFVATCIARRQPVRLRQAVIFLLVLACSVTIVFINRGRLHLGTQSVSSDQSTEEALNSLVGTSAYDEEHGTTGQEFILHAATIDAVDQTGKLDWGVNWVEFVFFNPIPRLLFPDKPSPVWSGVTSGDIFEQTSIVAAPGSAAGIVADLYSNFHLLSAFFLYGLGFGLRRLFVLALNFSSPLTTVGYVMIYALSLNMFAQGFLTILVPVCYSMVPVVLFAWISRWNRRKALTRRRDMVLRQLAAAHGEPWSS
jgi:hypothetical protein